jgi:prevent-host-death family protein
MVKQTVGIRELRSHLSEYLRAVKAGQTIVITEHGKPVGRIVPAKPIEPSVEDEMHALVQAGLAEWNGQPLGEPKARARVKGGHSVAQLIIDDRI